MSTPDSSSQKPRRFWGITFRIFCGLAFSFVALMAFCALCLACKARSDVRALREGVRSFETYVVGYHNGRAEVVHNQGGEPHRLVEVPDAPTALPEPIDAVPGPNTATSDSPVASVGTGVGE